MFENLSLRIKLLAFAAVGLIGLITVEITGISGIQAGINGIDEIGRKRLPSVIALQAIREAQTSLKSSTYEVALWENDTEAQDQFTEIAKDKKKTWSRLDTAWKDYERIPKSEEENQAWAKFVQEWNTWKKFDQQITVLIEQLAGNSDAAKQPKYFEQYFVLGGQQRPSYLAAEKLLNQVIELNARLVAAETESAENATRFAQNSMLTIGGIAILTVVVIGFLLSGSIVRQMGGDPAFAVKIVKAIAEGDLSVKIIVRPGDDRSLLASMAYMQEHLRALISQILGSATRLATSARNLNRDVSQVEENGRHEAEAASSTARAVEEISTQVAQIGAAAQSARSLSESSGQLSREGQGIVNHATSEMSNILDAVHESSEQIQKLGEYSSEISSIVSVIKDVADQTNLLALNAAIEAARAGEQGRGFAVVADEVRKLAERTAKSTQDIATMIGNIQSAVGTAVSSMQEGRNRVQDGVQLVHNAASKMDGINSSASDASRAVIEINDALGESAANLDEITQLMSNIVNMVDHNTGSIRTMSDSAQSIEQMSIALEQAAQRFKL